MNKLKTENASLRNNNEIVLQESVRIDTMTKRLARKRAFLAGAGWINQSKSSLFLDKIAANIPLEIQLEKLTYQPFDELESERSNGLVFDKNKIRIVGKTANAQVVYEWISQLKKLEFFSNVTIVNFKYDSKSKVHRAEIVGTIQ